MKKGSKLRKCHKCKKPVFWLVPNGYLFGIIPEGKVKKVNPFLYRNNKLWCAECWEKETKQND